MITEYQEEIAKNKNDQPHTLRQIRYEQIRDRHARNGLVLSGPSGSQFLVKIHPATLLVLVLDLMIAF